MRKVGLVILAGFILVLVFGGTEINMDAMALAIVAVVAVFGLLCALIAFLVHCQSMEAQAWAARPLPPALPQAQQQPMVLVLQQPQMPRYSATLPEGVVEGVSRELSADLFYPRRGG